MNALSYLLLGTVFLNYSQGLRSEEILTLEYLNRQFKPKIQCSPVLGSGSKLRIPRPQKTRADCTYVPPLIKISRNF